MQLTQQGILMSRQGIDLPEIVDNISLYQDLFTDQKTYNETFTPAAESGLEVWMDLSQVTAGDIPGSDDLLASIPNSGTSTDFFSSAKPQLYTNMRREREPILSGMNTFSDSWNEGLNKSFNILAGLRMEIAPAVQNPTYLEGFIVINPFYPPGMSGGQILFAHRSETTRLIQIGFDNDVADLKFFMQLRSSTSGVITITSTVAIQRIKPYIVYFKFDKAGNSHQLSVNGETPVTDTTAFGASTFTSTKQSLGMYFTTGWINGQYGFYHEFIMKYSALSDVAAMRRYLAKKYL
jgi:hypothetical protein